MRLPNPLIPGFNPDPSVVEVSEEYFLVTSTFEYLPGIPIHHSTDLVEWRLIGHVITRTAQFDATESPTNGGIWAPTIRHHDGVFHVIVATMETGTRIYTATDPAGPWSDGTPVPGIAGIDPDIAWDDDGNCYVTYSALILTGPDAGTHLGIKQARIDPRSGDLLDEPRSIWSGTGLMFPEAPHLYRIGDWWYLMIAEGGTERGHAVSIARSRSPEGPFEGCPANPVLSARSTARPVQNTGHADLVKAPDGSWSMVLLGMRTGGMTRAFSPLGRETFGTHVEWVDGWPVVDPVELTEGRTPPSFDDDFSADHLGADWIGVRRLPTDVASLADGSITIHGEGRSMSHTLPAFVGRRQRRLDARISTTVVDPSPGGGVGGLSVRYDEQHHYDIEVSPGRVTARACVPSLFREWAAEVPAGPVELVLEIRPTELALDPGGFIESGGFTRLTPCDTVRMLAVDSWGRTHDLATVDGRFLSAETACSFTGRVVGLYCENGDMVFDHYREQALLGAPS